MSGNKCATRVTIVRRSNDAATNNDSESVSRMKGKCKRFARAINEKEDAVDCHGPWYLQTFGVLREALGPPATTNARVAQTTYTSPPLCLLCCASPCQSSRSAVDSDGPCILRPLTVRQSRYILPHFGLEKTPVLKIGCVRCSAFQIFITR